MCICRSFLIDDVKLYAVPGSTETGQAERYLEGRGIRHEKVDVSTNAGALADMARLSAQTSRPVIVIGDRVFVGFSEEALEEVMP